MAGRSGSAMRTDPSVPPTIPVSLRRTISLPLLTFYGLGTTVGAGIYVLAGRIVGIAGPYAPFSFVLAALLAGLSALGFAELASRMPRSAGEALYVRRGLRSRRLAVVVGLLVVAAGIVSSATIARGFAGYLGIVVDGPAALFALAIVALLTVIAIVGILETVLVASILTVIEVGGLVVVVWVTRDSFAAAPGWFVASVASFDMALAVPVASGAVLAFFAFVGFEDMVNVAEEVRDPRRNMPIAIVLTLVVTTVLYLLVSLAVLLSGEAELLGRSEAPLAELFALETGLSPIPIVVVSTFAIVNGALIQIVMGARVLYGLARQRELPARLGRVHPRFRTPVVATLVVGAITAGATLALPLESLARIASVVVLAIFVLVNLALIAIKRRDRRRHAAGFRVPVWVPVCGLAASLALIAFQMFEFATAWL